MRHIPNPTRVVLYLYRIVNNEEWYPADWLCNCDKGNRLKEEICTGRFQ